MRIMKFMKYCITTKKKERIIIDLHMKLRHILLKGIKGNSHFVGPQPRYLQSKKGINFISSRHVLSSWNRKYCVT